jgi:hypothetical protein
MSDDRSQALVAASRFNSMRLLVSRAVPFIDSQSLEQRTAREALFRNRDGDYVLYLSNGVGSREVEERLICLDARDALIWINEAPESSGSFWD